ncbi:transglutaminase-like cysteine peptidase [Croceicoccus naphthovorans]|nr:transglutaminase-like cysteine peptidase [Croceicoccus naphthovorans]
MSGPQAAVVLPEVPGVTCAVQGEEPVATPQAETYVLPETGFVFAIPGAEEPQTAEPLPPCTPAPVRPRDLDIFGFHALPVGPAMAARWHDGALMALPENTPRVAGLTFGAARPGANPLELVNKRVNAMLRYVEDRGGDAWSPATDTLAARQGDCEDFAILKLALLAKLGIDPDDMFLVVVRDTERRIDHAVAAVRWQSRLWVLDNRVDTLKSAESVTDYVPLQSFSGQWAWTYGYSGNGSAAKAARKVAPR